MTQGVATTVICGHPMKFYNLDRPRDDYAPVCHRPPHEGRRHMSLAAVRHEKERQQRRRRRDTRGNHHPAGLRAPVLSVVPVSVAS